ncbi:LruC domain-containing protein [Pedobacter metabolipauper]|uniref:LruC domain-containing protein n=1 Tax=Pedobacter metabolipauper TaxID=425513 RepID=A0A4V3D0U8_9SPHI|nr:LruC domain-containing protein [Pedobacter metabolipauper]TDQ07539.1 LruC domain-containing protein [Pedobacter metabolipauper]
MKKSIHLLCLLFMLIAGLSSCKKSGTKDPEPDPISPIPSSFSYATNKELSISVRLLTNADKPIQGAVLNITDPNNSERVFLRAVSDANGYIRGNISVPSYMDTLTINPNYIGLLNNVRAHIGTKTSVNAIIGGVSMASGDIIPEVVKFPAVTNPGSILATGGTGNKALALTYGYPSPYTSSNDAIVNTSTYPLALGRPKYLEATADVIETSLLNYVNASLPEGKPITTSHPDYLSASALNNIVVTATSDIYVTFVSEGANNLNTLAYYAYDTDSPPANVTLGGALGGIDKITMVFPNASGLQSGGGLISGDRVKLGTFDAGTTIAFVLIQNGWNGSGVSTSSTKFYSETKFNPELSTTKKKHSVLLYDNVHSLYLMGFEDINREATSDNDFNDLVIYVKSSPANSVSTTGMSLIDKGGDTDGDGVIDGLDDFPNDPSRAYITYSPSATGWSTLAFEDNWPIKGDYDVNDLVVNYRYTFIKNAQNAVVEMAGEYQPVAAGASYKNGFGVQLPISASLVSSVTGQSLQSSYIQLASNGVESGQSKAVLIPFDNYENLLRNPDGSAQVNTDPAKSKVTPSKVTLAIKFISPVAAADLGTAPFNPFLIINLKRGYEVHLPFNSPTDKVTSSLFGTGDDNSNPATGRYYLGKDNSPWALSFTDMFSYPIEGSPITNGYMHFNEWATSGGTTFKDWYVNTAAGFRNGTYIYSK